MKIILTLIILFLSNAVGAVFFNIDPLDAVVMDQGMIKGSRVVDIWKRSGLE